jgi:hypothetical protein
MSKMSGAYLLHHSTQRYEGLLADLYLNDPYVWTSPFLWSFCHTRQRPKVEVGTRLYWLSRESSGQYVCDLVFAVGERIPLGDAERRYGSQNPILDEFHFRAGRENHPDYAGEAWAFSCVADMEKSFIPDPEVEIEALVDEIRMAEHPGAAPLRVAWRGPSSPLFVADDRLLHEHILAAAAARVDPLPWPSGAPAHPADHWAKARWSGQK